MDIQNRLLGFIHWPLSRRVVLLGVLGSVSTLLATLVNDWAHRGSDDHVLDLPALNRFMTGWIVLQILVTLINVPAARAGRAGRFGVYLFVMVQAPCMAWLMHLFGTMSSPMVAILPALAIFWSLYLDERIGFFGMSIVVLSLLLIGALEAHGLLPFAPVLLERSIDAQGGGVWFGTVLFHMLVLTTLCVSLSLLFLLSGRVQDQRLREAHGALERVNRLIRRYLPAQLAEQIVAGDYDEFSRPRRRRLSIVFVDIEGFTTASERMPGDQLESVVNVYLAEMMSIADRHGGTVSQIVGDGIMIFFGAPQVTNDRDHALRAVRMSLEMQSRVAQMQGVLHDLGWPGAFRVRIGINTGEANVGDFGPAGRKLYSGIGLQTNLAERIQSACTPGKVLMHRSTWLLVQEQVHASARGEITVKGVSEPVTVYEIEVEAEAASAIVAAPATGAAPLTHTALSATPSTLPATGPTG